MELKQLEYMIAIAEEQSISKAAEKLFISQSALNQQLLRLERDLGIPLFHRVKQGMIPTYAGEIYLETARKMLMMKEDTYRILQDIADMKKGQIAVAYTPEQGSLMFSRIYPVFQQMYPDITFKIFEARIKKAEQLLLQGNVNLAFTAHTPENCKPQFDYYFLAPELLVLGVPLKNSLAQMAGERSWETFPSIDLKLLEDIPLILVSHETRLRDMIDDLFAEAGIKPRILFEPTSSITAFNMVNNQIGPAFFPQSYVIPGMPIAYFSIGRKEIWMRSVLTRKGAYISKAENDFIHLAKELLSSGKLVLPPT